jgi:hypothetical protein
MYQAFKQADKLWVGLILNCQLLEVILLGVKNLLNLTHAICPITPDA